MAQNVDGEVAPRPMNMAKGSDLSMSKLVQLTMLAWSVDPRRTMRALYWMAIGKRLRGRSTLIGTAGQAKFAYETWIQIAERPWIERFFADRVQSPLVACEVFILGAETDEAATQKTVDSVLEGFGPGTPVNEIHGEKVDISLLEALAEGPEERWLLFLSPGDEVSVHLGRAITHAIGRTPDASIINWNTDKILSGRRDQPFIKPAAWDPILHAQADLLESASVIRCDKEMLLRLRHHNSQTSIDVSSLLASLAQGLSGQDFAHVPLILTHRPLRMPDATCASITLKSMGFVAPERWPSVTIIIPTRDRVELLRQCLSSLSRTTYPGPFDILVVDNDSAELETKTYLDTISTEDSISVIRVPGAFNFSSLNNSAVDLASGDFVCLLNNDVTVIDEDWLTSLVTVAMGDKVGAVGPMLLYPDDTIQHAGVVIGVGNAAGHIQRGIEPNSPIHSTWTSATRQVSAVTGACLLVRRSDYEAVNGLDEENFAVAFNDVDFCLKLQAAGRRNIYVAATVLYHHESKSRGSDLAPANFQRFSGELEELKKRWRTEGHEDPWFSPMFSKASEQCVLSVLPPA